MKWDKAFKLMKQGNKIKLPSWGGYWFWDNEAQSIMMHCKDNTIVDIRETKVVDYTFSNIASDEWTISNEENTPILGGEALFGFDEAIKYLKRGIRLSKKSWHKEGMFIECQVPTEFSKMTGSYLYINIGKYRNPWHPSQADMLENDWFIVN
ncbi:Thoeris anti-defense Tad2 family protein [Paraclostridium bifermentans]|uniref:Thoeris anti-defense Tad2 family protein n=1 Tax=Paraclostridium bifermentans TaxID=1490 RepID=UPI00359C644E